MVGYVLVTNSELMRRKIFGELLQKYFPFFYCILNFFFFGRDYRFADRAKVGRFLFLVFFFEVTMADLQIIGHVESFGCTSIPSRNRELSPRSSWETHQ